MLTPERAVTPAMRASTPGSSRTSILNILPVRVKEIRPLGDAQLNVLLTIGHGEEGPKLLARVKAADLLVLVGGRLGEMPSQSYTLLDIPAPRQTFVHVHPGVEELGCHGSGGDDEGIRVANDRLEPRFVFERMFGIGSTAAERITRTKEDRSVLDGLTQEISDLRKKLAAKAGIPEARPHTMRHLMVSLLLDAGRTPGGPASTIVDVTDGTPRLIRAGAVSWDEVQACVQRG